MTASHRILVRVACPDCEAVGELRVTEEAGPPFSDTPRRSYTVDPRLFSLLVDGEPLAMACVACGARFPRPG